MAKKWLIASIIVLSIILALPLVQIVSPLYQGIIVPGDKDGNEIISKAELASAILSYMLEEKGHLSLDEVRKIAHTHVYYPKTVVDYFERNVTIVMEPERIVSLAPSNTEILFALGLGNRVVGVTEYCNYPPEAKDKEKVGSMTDVNREKVIELSPHLALATNLLLPETVKELEKYLPVFVIDHKKIKTVEDIFTSIELIGEITEEEDKANELVAEMRGRVEEITEKTRGEESVNVTYIVWHEPLWVAGGGIFQNDVIEKAGGKNIFSEVEGWKPVGLEGLIKRNPDVIIVNAGHGAAGNATYEYIINNDNLKVVNAVKNGRVYKIDADIMSRPGPRIVEALEEMAKDLHPELTGL
jgi:iron complex transport system substrate-binding protein